MFTKHIALLPATAVAVLLSSPSLAQTFILVSPDQTFVQTSPNQTLESLLQNLQNPNVVRPSQVVAAFGSAVDEASKPKLPIPPPQNNQAPSPQQEALRRLEQQRKQQQIEQEQQRREAREQALESYSNVLNQIQQAMGNLNQQNQQAVQQKQNDAIDRFLDSLSEEQRLAFQQRKEEAARNQERILEERNESPEPGPEPQPEPDPNPEPSPDPNPEFEWLAEFEHLPDGVLTGRLPTWGDWGASYEGTVVGTADDNSSLIGEIYFGASESGEFEGRFTFEGSAGSVPFWGGITDSGAILADSLPGKFFDGDVLGQERILWGDLRGPNGENAGGEWSFEVTGGDRPGTAHGQFGAGLVVPQ